jgi:HD-GYP domain-containing protein (c-di-GMP phosphodiesterase class II)
VADAYDAMTSSRPYRDALPREVAMREIELGIGTQFHPEPVVAFLFAMGVHERGNHAQMQAELLARAEEYRHEHHQVEHSRVQLGDDFGQMDADAA